MTTDHPRRRSLRQAEARWLLAAMALWLPATAANLGFTFGDKKIMITMYRTPDG